MGNTASPGSFTVTPDAKQIIDVFMSVACSSTDSKPALTRIDERMLTDPEADVLLSARPQLARNCFLLIVSFLDEPSY